MIRQSWLDVAARPTRQGTGFVLPSLGPWPMMAAMRVIGQAAAVVAASKQYGTFLQPNA